MREWRSAVNNVLRRTTGFQLTRAAAPRDGHATDHGPTLADLGATIGYRVEPLAEDVHIAFRRTDGNRRRIVVDAVDDDAWVAQRAGKRRRDVVQVGNAALRTHLLVDPAATHKNMPGLQRNLGSYLAHEQVSLILSSLDINLVLDVGANIGQFATRLREHGYRGRIVSFEPVPQLAARLRERAQDDDDWLVVECALGEKEGTAEINASPGTLSSLLEPSAFGREWSSQLNEFHTETISVRRLDSLWDEVTAGLDHTNVYMKLDTQGFDLDAFRGAGDRIYDVAAFQSEVACVPIYEGMARLPESLAVYESAGFEIAGMYPVTYHRKTLRVIEFDMIMVRADASDASDASDAEQASAERP